MAPVYFYQIFYNTGIESWSSSIFSQIGVFTLQLVPIGSKKSFWCPLLTDLAIR